MVFSTLAWTSAVRVGEVHVVDAIDRRMRVSSELAGSSRISASSSTNRAESVERPGLRKRIVAALSQTV